MAMHVQLAQIGVDVSKAELVICEGQDRPVLTVSNEPKAISNWLKNLAGPAAIAVEATNTFHLELVEQAHRLGHTIYVIDGYRLNRYRESVGGRAKTDLTDARLVQRYLVHELPELRPWDPPPKAYVTIQRLLHRRAVLVQARVAIQQSLSQIKDLQSAARPLLRQLTKLDKLLTKRIMEAAYANGWADDINRLSAIEGFGPLISSAVTMATRRGNFRNGDAFVAFLGFDVRVRDSGQMRGRRKLTKKGDPELRRLLHLAAMKACPTATWKPFYQRYLARGFSRTQVLVILARKLARVAFALIKNQTQYEPRTPQEA